MDAQTIKNGEDSERKYREWHRSLGSPCFVQDIDACEVRYDLNGEPIVVAIIELTHYWHSAESMRTEALARVKSQKLPHLQLLANGVGCDVWLVVMDIEATDFHVLNMSKGHGTWFHQDRARHAKWLRSL